MEPGKGTNWLAVVDGQAGPEYDGVGSLIFSADGKRVGYAAKKEKQVVAVVDGQEGPEHDGVQFPDFQR